MSIRGGSLGLKRKRPGLDGPSKELTSDERNIHDLIKSKGDMGIWKGDIRKELNIANAKIVDNCVKSLQGKQLIKEVPNVQAKAKKRLMAIEFEPSTELTGGVWYQDGLLNEDLIKGLKKFCLYRLSKRKIATADGIRHEIKSHKGVEMSVEQVKEILDNLVLEKEISRLKGNGIGELASFPINADCYKFKPQNTKVGAFAVIPCGVCPRINHCAPDGIISPISCTYYSKWLEF
ncbi:hypothetical protein BVRB_5g121860 [Beta vulgaris subsp. vulgaris]|nr:hypothetical protein BVRB_5g121860 [Beta vulgaris subsp. vulgaris]